MSLLRHHLRRPPSVPSFFYSCRAPHSPPGYLARGLSTSLVARNESHPSHAQPRVVFSGIQPTGIPHVRSMLALPRHKINARIARESARGPFELGEASARRCAGGPAHLLDRGMARAHAPARPEGFERRTEGHACGITRCRARP